MNQERKIRVAVLDDYQNVALDMGDWGSLPSQVEVKVFTRHIADPQELVASLEPFEIVCVMLERTPLPRTVLERLPNLRLIITTGKRNRSIDTEAARARNILIANTRFVGEPTVELTWALILAKTRYIAEEGAAVRDGLWQQHVGMDLHGKTLGVLGLGRVGSRVSQIARAFGMNVIAWSQNLTPDRAQACGARLVTKEQLFEESDIVTIHLILSDRTRGLVTSRELELMKPTAILVNTSRGPIVVEQDLIEALGTGRIRGAALDVFGTEPLPEDHPFRRMPQVLATPHVGYVSEAQYRVFYEDMVRHVRSWAEGRVPDSLVEM